MNGYGGDLGADHCSDLVANPLDTPRSGGFRLGKGFLESIDGTSVWNRFEGVGLARCTDDRRARKGSQQKGGRVVAGIERREIERSGTQEAQPNGSDLDNRNETNKLLLYKVVVIERAL